jgi:teichoic acid transport system permease protein
MGVPTLTTAVATDPDAGLSGAELAAKYGLSVAGSRPSLLKYSQQLWAYRHFITHYAAAGVLASFGKAKLGQLWQILTPLCNIAVYYLIFGIIIGTSSGIPNYLSYLCLGMFVFSATRDSMTNGANAIARNLGLIRALHFPRACLPLSTTVGEFKDLAISMALMLGIVLLQREPIEWRWLLLIPVLALQAVFNAGISMFMARLGNKILDLRQLLPFITRTWLYASGVMYAATRFTDTDRIPQWLGKVLLANPMIVYIELARHALLVQVHLTQIPISETHLWMLGIGWAVFMIVVGYVYFWRGEQEYGRG